MLVTFTLGAIDIFKYFSWWYPQYQAEFIFSCCIGPVVWAAALVLAIYDRSHLRQVRGGGTERLGDASCGSTPHGDGAFPICNEWCSLAPALATRPPPQPVQAAAAHASASAAAAAKLGGDSKLDVFPESLGAPQAAALV